MKKFNDWMEKQEQQAEKNFPGHKERSTKLATVVVGGIAAIASIGCLLAGLLLLFTMPLLGVFVLLAAVIPLTVTRLAFDKDFRARSEVKKCQQ